MSARSSNYSYAAPPPPPLPPPPRVWHQRSLDGACRHHRCLGPSGAPPDVCQLEEVIAQHHRHLHVPDHYHCHQVSTKSGKLAGAPTSLSSCLPTPCS